MRVNVVIVPIILSFILKHVAALAGTSLCVLGVDQYNWDFSPLYLSGHLTPGAAYTEGGQQTVHAHSALQRKHKKRAKFESKNTIIVEFRCVHPT